MALFFQDDKHFISVGEPNLPTAALDHGQRALGHRAHAVAALDHDFTKAKLQSLCAVNFLPHQMTFYRGNVVVHVKDGVLSPSSALRHSWELDHILNSVLQTTSTSEDDSESSSTPFIPPIVTIHWTVDWTTILAIATSTHLPFSQAESGYANHNANRTRK